MKGKRVVVLGAGISGLTAAFAFKKIGAEVKVLEKSDLPGGTMRSIRKNGYLIDYGPNSGLETTPFIKELVDDVGISDELIYASAEAKKRYILKKGELIALPTSPKSFVKTDLFSFKAKLRLLGEPFVGKSEDGYYQSIGEFVERRLGKEFLTYAIDPFVSGVYAGDPSKLSVKSAFPKLYALEEKYGGLIKGMIKGAKERKARGEVSKDRAKMFSFKSGMQTLPFAIANKLRENIIFNARVVNVEKKEKTYKVEYIKDEKKFGIETDIIYSALPAYVAAGIFSNLDNGLTEKLKSVFYPKVMVLFLGYDRTQISRELDGFGFLIPGVEKKAFLGAIWSSVIFSNRAPEGKEAFTLFIGGARNQEINWKEPEKIIMDAINEFSEIMRITGSPEIIEYNLWEKAIPQYNVGYIELEKVCSEFESKNPGIYLSGNFRGGISVGDCIRNNFSLKMLN